MSLKIIQNKVEQKYVVLYQMEKQAMISHHITILILQVTGL